MPQPQLNSHFFNDFKELFKKILSFLKKKKVADTKWLKGAFFCFFFFFYRAREPFLRVLHHSLSSSPSSAQQRPLFPTVLPLTFLHFLFFVTLDHLLVFMRNWCFCHCNRFAHQHFLDSFFFFPPFTILVFFFFSLGLLR